MKNVSMVGVTGKMLRSIREKSGWSRERLSRRMSRDRMIDDDKDFTSVRSLARFESEGNDEVPPLQVQRYRQTIGPEIFDELLLRVKNEAARRDREERQQRRAEQEERLREQQGGRNDTGI